MIEVILDIKQWSSNLGVPLSAAIVREAQVHVDRRVRLKVSDGQIIITPVMDESLTLERHLAYSIYPS